MLSPFQAGDLVTDAGALTALWGLFGMALSFHGAVEDVPMGVPQVPLLWMLCLVKLFSVQPL